MRTLGLSNMGRAVIRRLLGVFGLRFVSVHAVSGGGGQATALDVGSAGCGLDICGRLHRVGENEQTMAGKWQEMELPFARH